MNKTPTTKQVDKSNNPTGKGGFGDNPENINPTGRPKNSMKSYVAKKLAELSDKDKAKWLKEHKISGIDQWKMGEGNPSNEIEHKGKLTIEQVLTNIENEETPGQKVEDEKSVQDSG